MSYSSDHVRLGGQKLRDWPGERMEQIVVMRKLNLSERRDSFKKQEAVQEVSFDEPDDQRAGLTPTATAITSTPATGARPKYRAEWVVADSQSREECAIRRVPLVPQIAVQGSESEELEDWQPCSDDEDEEKSSEVNSTEDSQTESKEGPENGCSSKKASDISSAASKCTAHNANSEASNTSPRKGKLKEK